MEPGGRRWRCTTSDKLRISYFFAHRDCIFTIIRVDVLDECWPRISRFNYYCANYSLGCRIDVRTANTPPSVVGRSRARQFADTRCSAADAQLVELSTVRVGWSEINEGSVIDACKFTVPRQQRWRHTPHSGMTSLTATRVDWTTYFFKLQFCSYLTKNALRRRNVLLED
jgi:hypothetical protein